MSNIRVNGTQVFMGKKIRVIEGGFGNSEKVVLASDVALIHSVEVKRINELVGRNIDEFEIGVDILDLCDKNFEVVANDLGFIVSNGQKHCYLFSERGYMTLAMLMRTEKSKEIRKQFINEYFTMREAIRKLSKKQELALVLFDGGSGAIAAHKELLLIETEELKEKHRLELLREIDGSNKILSGLQEVVNILSIKGLTTTLFRDWLISRDLGSMVKFEGDKNRTFIPNEKFYEYVSKAGYSYTGTTLTNKPKVIYSTRFINRIQEEHIVNLIDFVRMNTDK